ncbi:hypothetical protein RAA17_05190 [Komagataeibacter rhaeticus]|nr:hypothetical protein [Komagataeibacter rhaeticus]
MSVPAAQGCMVNGMAVRGGGCGGMDVAGMPGCMGLPCSENMNPNVAPRTESRRPRFMFLIHIFYNLSTALG